MGYVKFALALAFAAGLAAFPADALAAAQRAMRSWALSVAPAMLPFIAVMPFLTCPEARRVYDKLLGRTVRGLFRLPGGCASAIVTGLIAGSPAGAAAVKRVAAAESLTRGQAARLAGIACGVSPAYALSVMGVMLAGSAAVGWRLVISQLLAQLLTGVIFRRFYKNDDEPVVAPADDVASAGVFGAVSAVLRVCGYMVLFAAGLAIGCRLLGDRLMYLSPLIDLPTGAEFISVHITDVRLSAAALGFGGLCIAFQNMSQLAAVGVSWRRYLAQKAACAALCGALAGARTELPAFAAVKTDVIFEMETLFSALIMLPVAIYFMRTQAKKHLS